MIRYQFNSKSLRWKYVLYNALFYLFATFTDTLLEIPIFQEDIIDEKKKNKKGI